MDQSYKIFVNNISIFLTNGEEEIVQDVGQNLQGGLTLFIDWNGTPDEIQHFLNILDRSDGIGQAVISTDKLEDLKKVFFSMFTYIGAAGGLVQNKEGELLFIYRKQRWDLPKGKIEKGENKRVTAVREVLEETGLKEVKITDELISTFHTYADNGQKILKETFWFAMTTNNSDTNPQSTEGITAIKWYEKSMLKDVRDNTFLSILDVLDSLH